MKAILGLVLALAIGIGCRLAGIPLPAPPVLIGALLVLAMTLGYVLTDRFASHRASTSKPLCGGPTGSTKGGSHDGRRIRPRTDNGARAFSHGWRAIVRLCHWARIIVIGQLCRSPSNGKPVIDGFLASLQPIRSRRTSCA